MSLNKFNNVLQHTFQLSQFPKTKYHNYGRATSFINRKLIPEFTGCLLYYKRANRDRAIFLVQKYYYFPVVVHYNHREFTMIELHKEQGLEQGNGGQRAKLGTRQSK
jgi:hypothetical protein